MSQLVAPRRGQGGGRRRGAGDGLPDQQPGVESPDHRRPLPLPLADRGVLQGTQIDPPVGRFPRPQRQRGAVADLDRAPALPAAALPGLPEPVGSQLHAPFHSDTFGSLAETLDPQPLGSLGDSLWPRAVPGNTPAGLFARPDLNLWDSRSPWRSPLTQILNPP